MDEDIRDALWQERYTKNQQEQNITRLIDKGDPELAALYRSQQADPNDPLLKKVLLGDEVRKRMIDNDAYAKLGRYEVQLRRGLYQAVRELRMLRTQHLRNFPPTPRRTAGPDRQEPATTGDTPFADDKARDTAPGTDVVPVRDRDKTKKVDKAKKAEKVKESAKPSPEPRRGLGPRCGRMGRIVQSRVEGATREMILPDGSVVRIS